MIRPIVRNAALASVFFAVLHPSTGLHAEEGGHNMNRPRPLPAQVAPPAPGAETRGETRGEGGGGASATTAEKPGATGNPSAAFPVTVYSLKTDGNRPQAICVGPDGNFWVTEVIHHQIVKVTLKGEVTQYAVTATEGGPEVGVLQGIAPGPDGKLWFTSREENAIRVIGVDGKLGKTFTIQSGKEGYMPGIKTKSAWPREIAPGADGTLWFAEMAVNSIAHIDKEGKITEYPLPTPNSNPYRVVLGPDKAIWYSGWGVSKIGRLDPATGKVTEFPAPSGCRELCFGPDGNIWYTGDKGNKIGRMTVKGEVTEFAIPTEKCGPVGICAGPDQAMYFCEIHGGKVGRVTLDGKITEIAIPGEKPQPFTLTLGPDNNIWVALQANAIAKITLPAK